MSADLGCLNCGAFQANAPVVSLKDRKPYCPVCRCRQFVTAEAFAESWEKFDRHVGYCCTFKPETEIPTVRLFSKEGN